MDPDHPPEGDRIYDLYTGVYRPQMMRVAMRLDVFSPLAAGADNAEAVARACKCDVVGVRRLMDYLASLDVLEKRGDEYSLSPEAATFLVRGRKAYAGDLIIDETGPALWDSLTPNNSHWRASQLSSGDPFCPGCLDRELPQRTRAEQPGDVGHGWGRPG